MDIKVKTTDGYIHNEINPETGEVERQYAVVPIFRKKIKEGWFMAIQEGFLHLAQLDLTGEQLRVLLYIMGKLDFENYICLTQKSVSEALNLHKSNVSKAFKVLVEKGIIHEGPKVGRTKTYRLDPSFGYKGRYKNYEKVKKAIQKAKDKGIDLEVISND